MEFSRLPEAAGLRKLQLDDIYVLVATRQPPTAMNKKKLVLDCALTYPFVQLLVQGAPCEAISFGVVEDALHGYNAVTLRCHRSGPTCRTHRLVP
jgi:hypothetical protein